MFFLKKSYTTCTFKNITWTGLKHAKSSNFGKKRLKIYWVIESDSSCHGLIVGRWRVMKRNWTYRTTSLRPWAWPDLNFISPLVGRRSSAYTSRVQIAMAVVTVLWFYKKQSELTFVIWDYCLQRYLDFCHRLLALLFFLLLTRIKNSRRYVSNNRCS